MRSLPEAEELRRMDLRSLQTLKPQVLCLLEDIESAIREKHVIARRQGGSLDGSPVHEVDVYTRADGGFGERFRQAVERAKPED